MSMARLNYIERQFSWSGKDIPINDLLLTTLAVRHSAHFRLGGNKVYAGVYEREGVDPQTSLNEIELILRKNGYIQ